MTLFDFQLALAAVQTLVVIWGVVEYRSGR